MFLNWTIKPFQWSRQTLTENFRSRPIAFTQTYFCELVSFLTWERNLYYGSVYRQDILNLTQFKVFSNIGSSYEISIDFLAIGL